jgi:GT2 family glycosyltransferase
MLAQGEILAFIDDDCIPSQNWLLNARQYFARPRVVGIEGLIGSDHFGDPNYRPVSNIGSEGIGFMTANLLVRSAVFQYLGGFDLQFDRPHFREDTDFGWRMLDLGEVPYASDVSVFHPAQKREIERESFEARAHFFVKDALLCEKHPERYRILCEFEQQYLRTPGFTQHVLRGFEELGKAPPDWLMKKLHSRIQS